MVACLACCADPFAIYTPAGVLAAVERALAEGVALVAGDPSRCPFATALDRAHPCCQHVVGLGTSADGIVVLATDRRDGSELLLPVRDRTLRKLVEAVDAEPVGAPLDLVRWRALVEDDGCLTWSP